MEEYFDAALAMIIAYAPKVLGAIVTLIIGFWLAVILANYVR